MKPGDIMKGAPALPEAQVTRLNWRDFPYSRWSFRNLRQVLPTAEIHRSRAPSTLTRDMRDLSRVSFAMPSDDATTTVAETLRDTYADGLLVMHRGQVVTEWYGEGMAPHTQHLVCSVGKSITGTLGGALVERDLLDTAKRVADYIPEVAGSVYAEVTVRHLLDMTVGVAFEEDYEATEGEIIRYRLASGWLVLPNGASQGDQRSFLATMKPSGKPHGVAFDYVSPNTDMLGWVYERAAGAPFAQLLSEYVWVPMGAEEDAYVSLDSHGSARAAGGICATIRDLGRFGEMMRQRGVANGKQVVPGIWVDDIMSNGDAEVFANGKLATVFPGARYRSKWWNLDPARGVFAAIGIHGQWIYVDPESETVVVKVATQPMAMDLPLDYRWLAAFRAIAAHLSGTAPV